MKTIPQLELCPVHSTKQWRQAAMPWLSSAAPDIATTHTPRVIPLHGATQQPNPHHLAQALAEILQLISTEVGISEPLVQAKEVAVQRLECRRQALVLMQMVQGVIPKGDLPDNFERLRPQSLAQDIVAEAQSREQLLNAQASFIHILDYPALRESLYSLLANQTLLASVDDCLGVSLPTLAVGMRRCLFNQGVVCSPTRQDSLMRVCHYFSKGAGNQLGLPIRYRCKGQDHWSAGLILSISRCRNFLLQNGIKQGDTPPIYNKFQRQTSSDHAQGLINRLLTERANSKGASSLKEHQLLREIQDTGDEYKVVTAGLKHLCQRVEEFKQRK